MLRLVNGSDCPLPAVNVLIWLRALEDGGFIFEEGHVWLEEIYRVNPLLFDFVLKRMPRHPGTSEQLQDKLFGVRPELRGAVFR